MSKLSLLAFITLILWPGGPAVTAQQPASAPQPAKEVRPSQTSPRRPPAQQPPAPPTHPSSRPGESVQVEPVSVKLGKGGKVAISSKSGQITISGWDRDIVEASATSDYGPEPIQTQTTGDSAHPRLLLLVPSSTARRFAREINLEVKVPRYAEIETLEGHRGDLEISNVEGATLISAGIGDVRSTRMGPLKVSRRSGDVTVKEVKGDFVGRSYRGDILVDNVSGLVDVAATNGRLTVHNTGGDVRANSATGDINIHCAKGRAEVASASGSITLVGIAGDAEASTASGRVAFTGSIRGSGTYRFKSLSGEVTMNIQSDAPGFTATLTTYSGSIETEFPLKVESPVQRGPMNRRLTGTFGDGKAKIALDSFSGMVKVAKANAARLRECR